VAHDFEQFCEMKITQFNRQLLYFIDKRPPHFWTHCSLFPGWWMHHFGLGSSLLVPRPSFPHHQHLPSTGMYLTEHAELYFT